MNSQHIRAIRFGAIFGLLLIAGFFSFYPATSGPFLFDDFPNLANLEKLEGEISLPQLGEYLAAWQGTPGRPLSALTFLIEANAWPSEPYAFKRNNILWHLLAGVLIFGLSRKLSTTAGAAESLANSVGLATMAIWLIHPIHLSTTMLVVQRMTILSQGIIAAGLWLYLVILTRPEKNLPNAVAASTVLGIFATIAYLAKENGPLIFAYAAVINFTLGAGIVRQYPDSARKLLWASTLGLTLLLMAGLIWLVKDPATAYASREFTLWERLLTQPRVLLDYLQIIFVPGITGSIYHDDFLISHSLLKPIATILALGGLIGAIALALGKRKQLPLVAFAILWFLAGHLMESTVLQLEIYFEHRNYLAMLGPIFAIVVALARFPQLTTRVRVLASILTVFLLAGMTYTAAQTWGKPLQLAQSWANEKPQSVRAQQLYASELTKIGAYEEAEHILKTAQERMPEASEFEFQKAMLDCISGTATRETFTSLAEFAKKANWARIIPDIVNSLRLRLDSSACGNTLTLAALEEIILNLVHNKNFSRNRGTAGYLYNELGRAYVSRGNLESALVYLGKSNEFGPSLQQAINRVYIALEIGDFRSARDAITNAHALNAGLESRLRRDSVKIERAEFAFNAVVRRKIQDLYVSREI